MSLSPLAYVDSLRIGTVDFVSPDEIRVQLDIEAPDQMALNTGDPRAFPRVNGYVLIPCDEGYLVAQVAWITIERSQYPKRQGLKDFGLVDLPYPLRKLSLNPMGLLSVRNSGTGKETFDFRRGVVEYPTVGDPVLLPTQSQLKSIVESGDKRYVLIGHSPLAANAEVRIDPDRLFGRHLAVLGNTGSGKSCSVAGLIRWSLEEAKKQQEDPSCLYPNARFIILDPNGEYSYTFNDIDGVRVFAVENNESQRQLKIPFWLWNTEEWVTFAKASGRAQKPVLVQALQSVRDGSLNESFLPTTDVRRYLRNLISALQISIDKGDPFVGFPYPLHFLEMIQRWPDGLNIRPSFSKEQKDSLNKLKEHLLRLIQDRSGVHPNYTFSKIETGDLLSLLRNAHQAFGGDIHDFSQLSSDVPRPFTGDQLLKSIEGTSEMMNHLSDYTETMLMRIRTLLADSKLKAVSGDEIDISLADWLNDYIGANQGANGSICVIDLSMVPSEIIQIITAVIARMTLESLQRYRKLHDGDVLPTVLVMEEAHTFIKRYSQDSDDQSTSRLCTEVFEKIAREGRKFGLGLVLSSQRPSELSPTVLSQCNSFLLHRISNDRDQDLVQHLVPDNMHGLMRDLPVLPARQAILMGWASELPVLVEMNELPENQRPQSSDPDFWDVWTGAAERSVDWKAIADDWQQYSSDVEDQEKDESGDILDDYF